MGAFTYNAEHTSSVPPQRLFKALVLDSNNLIPKVVPESIKSSENIEGNGGPGTVKKITFPEGSQFKFVKHRLDAIDETNFTHSYTVFDGDGMENTMEKIVYEIKMVPSGGGTIIKSTRTYHTKGDHKLNEEFVKRAEAKATKLFKAVDDYLAENPTEYN